MFGIFLITLTTYHSLSPPFQVDNPSQFIQGYRVLYRQTSGLPSPGQWQTQDLKVSSDRDITLAGLRKGIVYEIKVRPFFNEFQGADSESMTARTMEEGKPSNIHGDICTRFYVDVRLTHFALKNKHFKPWNHLYWFTESIVVPCRLREHVVVKPRRILILIDIRYGVWKHAELRNMRKPHWRISFLRGQNR